MQTINLIQPKIKLILLKMTVDQIIKSTYADIYSEDNTRGYQRPLVPSHFKKIAAYLESDPSASVVSSFILAFDGSESELRNEINSPSMPPKVRIVDGQHRTAAFEYIRSTNLSIYNNKFHDMELPVTVILNNDEGERDVRLAEIKTFINLNSKGKRVSTDLAIRLRDEMRSVEGVSNDEELIEHIAVKTTLKLDKEMPQSVWFGMINTSPMKRNGIISINAFVNSLKPILKSMEFWHDQSYVLPVFIDKYTDFIDSAWYLVNRQWPQCFQEASFIFRKNYYIQKGIGVYSLHKIINELMELETADSIDEKFQLVLDHFERILKDSNIESRDWVVGGEFQGYSSQAGFKLIASKIKGTETG